MQLLIATRNAHKLEEIQAILQLPGIEIVGADAVPGLPDVVEDGDTFEANAIKKAVELAAVSGMLTLADDSGLEVDALDKAPGVYSARYAGEPCDDAANNRKLLSALEGVTERTARFRCAIALATPEGQTETVDGRCEGHIELAPRGDCGFGYDPLFVPNGFEQTFAELDADAKHSISHRGAALSAAKAAWWNGSTFGLA
ncbi:MAG: XTP/dITP diphosphatase [Verrucomicrobia bacterium]|jgi:XTP/dITP diphosphohydrolase|nr:XTP/dITP diphosphatase [Verrucomicrobiota bacterium]